MINRNRNGSLAIAVLPLLVQLAASATDSSTMSSRSGAGSRTYLQSCTEQSQCRGDLLEYCDTAEERCKCLRNTGFDAESGECRPCRPDCADCCSGQWERCVGGVCRDCRVYGNQQLCWENLFRPTAAPSPNRDLPAEQPPPSSNNGGHQQEAVIYITASQIALSAALIMGSVAIISLLYRICSKPAVRQRRTTATIRTASATRPRTVAAPRPPNAFQRLSQRLSLTSMQARVLSRLRDQPPKYESEHSYCIRLQQEMQQHQQQQQQLEPQPEVSGGALPADAVAISMPAAAPASAAIPTVSGAQQRCPPFGMAPPCYDNEAYSMADLPPPYTPPAGGMAEELAEPSAGCAAGHRPAHTGDGGLKPQLPQV